MLPLLSYLLPAKALASLAQGPCGKLSLVASPGHPTPVTVWDTFDQALRRSGRALWEDSGRFTLLLPDGAILAQAADRKGNFAADLAPGPVKAALADLSALRCLLPMTRGEITETRLALTDDLHKTCVRAELRLFNTETRALLITLQGLRGYDKALEALRAQVLTLGGEAPRTLCARLVGDTPYTSKPEVRIEAADSAFDAATRIIATYLPVVRANEPGILADHDTEFLHQYRIGLRKIRLILGLFEGVYRADRTQDLRDRFAKLMRATGPLRDLDVAILDRDHAHAMLPPSLHPGLEALFAALATERQEALRQMAAHLQGRDYAAEIKTLTRLFDKPRHLGPGKLADVLATDLALRLILARHQKICQAAARITPETPDEDLHLIRLHLKKLRYLIEFFAPLFAPVPYKVVRKTIKGLQDLLGQFNDGVVQQVSLQEVLLRQAAPPVAMAQSVGALMAVLHGCHGTDRAAAIAALQAFTGPDLCTIFHSMLPGQGDLP
ncbi:CHAD domain-containing protein [Rhodobacter sp. KR11]|uniref:CHAD domain-containing protein n=1 Tax=Rhodobacter sp. KR11 TaxID=2974588 RepID=UPI002223D6AD|nr:CHAD domain-containing protein [Rhodobacter sp. KR11]MCW1918066.1 CHAD domain-containing protein [Rhodobacter sp. KR11]